MTARGARLVRGWAAALSATAAAAAFHVMAGGVIPHPSILLLSLALSAMVSCFLAGRMLSLPRISAAVLASQGIFHLLFTVGGAGIPPETAASGTAAEAYAAAHAGHFGAGAGAGFDSGPGSGIGAAAVSPLADATLLMWAGHLLAAVLTVALIRNGEGTMVRLGEAIALRVTAFLPVFQPLPLGPRIAKLSTLAPVVPLPSLGIPFLVMRHRGPPAAAVS